MTPCQSKKEMKNIQVDKRQRVMENGYERWLPLLRGAGVCYIEQN